MSDNVSLCQDHWRSMAESDQYSSKKLAEIKRANLNHHWKTAGTFKRFADDTA
jgi:hypothetical protein